MLVDNDLQTLVARFATALRKYDKATTDFRDLMRNWEVHRARYEKGEGPAPWEIRGPLIQEMLEAQKAFWAAVRELVKAVSAEVPPSQPKEEPGS